MRKIIVWAAGGAALAALATPAAAQNSASATATASATILSPLTITKTSDLGFGSIVKPTSGASTVTVSAAGTRTVTGNAAIAGTAGVSNAAFMVIGEGATHFAITVPGSFNMTSGANTLVVTTSNPTGATGVLNGALGGSGSLSLGIGGSFTLTSATKSGAYQGNLIVTVAYN